jgi:hypothetical protein
LLNHCPMRLGVMRMMARIISPLIRNTVLLSAPRVFQCAPQRCLGSVLHSPLCHIPCSSG